MKKIKKVQSLLLTLLLLSFSVFANFIYVSADTDDEIVTDESVVEPMDSFEGFESNVFEYPTVDENYISYLSKPSMTRTVATSSLQMSQGGIVDYADIVKSDGSKANISLKYVVNDGSGDMVDSSGNAKWRMVYCLEYKKNYPQGTNTYDGGASLSKYIVYCLTYGVQYWGETSTYTPYSTGDWKKDYAVTQYAIHALNLEFVPGGSYEQNRDWILSHITYSDVKKKTAQLINDALNDGNYKGFSGNNYTGYKYFLSPSTQSEWSAYTYNGQSGYITNNWYTQDFRDTIYTSKSKPWYIKYVSSSVSGVDGAKIVWENSKSWSGFKIWVPKAAYEAAQINGATVSVSLTNQIPGYLSAWRYNPSDTSFQVSTLYEAGSYSSQTNKVTATIEKVVPKTGSICLTKSSMEPEFTDNNSLYSLQDAVYTVYEKGTSIEVGTIITDFQGKGSLEGLTLGEYDIKETTAPEGFVLDTNVYSVTLSETDSASVSIDVADTPQMAPITVLLQKTDAETGKTSPQGTAVLSGAEFVVKYYDVLSGTEDPAITDNIPVRTWIFQTDDNGLIQYDSSFLISGDDLYITAAGIPAIPLGTIVIQETKAPEGYLLNDEIVIIPIDSNTTSENTISYAVPTIPENILNIKLKKIQSGTEKVIPGAIFEHTRPNGEVEFSTTDENGELTFNGLEWGEHRIKEISVSEGYSVNTNEIKFSVNEQNKITIHSELVETDTDGKITITVNDEGKIEAAVEDKPLPYSFHGIKMNDKGLIIEGAEFTMYSDRECTDVIDRQITDNEGVFIMDNMIPGKYYYLKETKAPQGYRLPESRNLIEIYVESIPVEGVFDFYINGTKYTEKDTDTTREIYLGGTNADRVIYINVVNKTGLLLPETGSCMTILLIFTGVILATSGLILSKYKGIIVGGIYMKNRNMMIRIMALALAGASVIYPASAAVTVMADTITVQSVTPVTTPGGTASLGTGTATVTIYGKNASQDLVGKSFNIYQLFHAENSKYGESINYTFNDACKEALQNVVGDKLGKSPENVTEYEVIDYIQSLNQYKVEGAQTEQGENGYYSDFRYFIEELRDELVRLGNSAADNIQVTEVREDGSVYISGLDYGYYIIDEVTNTSGENSASSLCIVDTANPDSGVKIKSDYPSVDKAIREDDNREEVGDDGWNDMADYEIGQTVPFRFTSNVPDMNGYHSYYYAWHDVMDEALTFDPDSVNIMITEGENKYTLSSGEYTVTENMDDDTFLVEIEDLKSIVDTNFDHMDKNGHNTYGQSVILTYNTTLNDKAAEDTGTPGFENKVRLEFSNNPDSTGDGGTTGDKGETGVTPWSPVVCFTYRLDGLKINDHDSKLENAKFRLYLDEDCTDEVYVKKTDAGYIVINDDSVTGDAPESAVEMASDEDGIFSIIGLDSGTYYLKETDAPDGYREILDPIKLDITATFADDRNSYVEGDGENGKALTALQFTADIKQFTDGILNEEEKELETNLETGTGNLTVINKVGSKLPITGSTMTIIMLGAGCVLMITAGVINKKKKALQ